MPPRARPQPQLRRGRQSDLLRRSGASRNERRHRRRQELCRRTEAFEQSASAWLKHDEAATEYAAAATDTRARVEAFLRLPAKEAAALVVGGGGRRRGSAEAHAAGDDADADAARARFMAVHYARLEHALARARECLREMSLACRRCAVCAESVHELVAPSASMSGGDDDDEEDDEEEEEEMENVQRLQTYSGMLTAESERKEALWDCLARACYHVPVQRERWRRGSGHVLPFYGARHDRGDEPAAATAYEQAQQPPSLSVGSATLDVSAHAVLDAWRHGGARAQPQSGPRSADAPAAAYCRALDVHGMQQWFPMLEAMRHARQHDHKYGSGGGDGDNGRQSSSRS